MIEVIGWIISVRRTEQHDWFPLVQTEDIVYASEIVRILGRAKQDGPRYILLERVVTDVSDNDTPAT